MQLMMPSEIDVYNRESMVELINGLGELARKEKKFLKLTERNGRKEVLAKLGFDKDTKDDHRVVRYQDSVQEVFFKAIVRKDGNNPVNA